MSTEIIKGFPSTSGNDYQLNIITFLKSAATTYPEVEVVSRNIDGSIFRYNYYEAYQRTKKLANALIKLGIKPGDRVGIADWNTHRFSELYYAISGIGAVALELNPRIAGVDRAYVINHAEAKLIFVADTLLPIIEPIAGDLNTVQGYVVITDKKIEDVKTGLSPVNSYEDILAPESAEYTFPMIDETSAFAACYTSGTTGKPKGVFVSHRAMYLHTLMIANMTKMGLDDVIMQTVPMFHAQGWGVFLCAPLVGAKLVFSGMYTAEATNTLVDLMISEKVTVNNGAPAIYMPMLEQIRSMPEKPDFANLRMLSGATEPPLAMMKGYDELGGNVIHAYGATETTPLVTINLLKSQLSDLSENEKWELRKKQGLPVTGIEMKIVNADGEDAPHDGETVGELLIKGPWITSSYYNDPRTAESFTDGYWRSGDAATIDKNGYVKISDRFKDLIKSGGEWISSIDLENSLMAHEGVLEASVAGLPHPKWEERPLALVILRENFKGKTTKQELLDFISPNFAKWQLPDQIVFVDEIPKTSVGKFSKKTIREQYKDFYKDK